jgi:hypothetical protein
MAREPLTTVVVNCEAFALPDEEHVAEIRAEALRLLELGGDHVVSAQNVLAQAAALEARKEELGPVEELRELTAEELEQHALDQADGARQVAAQWRMERDARLAASDWTMLDDAGKTESQRRAWAEYRQALRDLPFDEEPDYPEVPKS